MNTNRATTRPDVTSSAHPNAHPNVGRIECFAIEHDPPDLVPAAPLRNWMESITDKHAYRCLPMTIANTYGWEILSPCDIAVDWNGGPNKSDLTTRVLDGSDKQSFAHSNFNYGIVTFHTGYLFRTPPGWDLLATGSFNNPKHGISPLSGVMETDWLPYPFTMNWMMTTPGTVVFERDEPFCLLFPVEKQLLDDFTPVIRHLDDDPALKADYELFRTSREAFFKRLADGERSAVEQPWQRHYFRGEYPDGRREETHANKMRVKRPLDLRNGPPK